MNKNLSIYYETAKKLKLPVTYLNVINCLQISLGKRTYYFKGAITPINSGSSMFISKNKNALLLLLKTAGFPVPNHIAINKNSGWHQLLPELTQNLTFPVVIKPMLDTHSGAGVICNIKTAADLAVYLKKSFKIYPYMQIEEFNQGLREYRVLVFKNLVIAVERIAAQIAGDGKKTISELIAAHNCQLSSKQSAIQINSECRVCLSDQGLGIDDVVPEGKIVRLFYPVNRALGGRVCSLGNKIPRENANYLRKAAKITGLHLVGFDILCEDIQRPFSQSKWLIIEANFGPGISIHEFPEEGIEVNISQKILMQFILRHPWAYMAHRINLFFKKNRTI